MRNSGWGLSSGQLPLIHGSRWGHQLMGQSGAGWSASGSFSTSACPRIMSRVFLAQLAMDQALTPWTRRSNPVLDEALALDAVIPVPEHYNQGLTHLRTMCCSQLLHSADRITQERSYQHIKLCNVGARTQTQVEANCTPRHYWQGSGLDPRIVISPRIETGEQGVLHGWSHTHTASLPACLAAEGH